VGAGWPRLGGWGRAGHFTELGAILGMVYSRMSGWIGRGRAPEEPIMQGWCGNGNEKNFNGGGLLPVVVCEHVEHAVFHVDSAGQFRAHKLSYEARTRVGS
jgi:hypothetical protein